MKLLFKYDELGVEAVRSIPYPLIGLHIKLTKVPILKKALKSKKNLPHRGGVCVCVINKEG